MINLPTTADLECDECNEIIEVDLTLFAGDPETVGFDHHEMPEGWAFRDGEHLCPNCNKDEDHEV